jgi:hypothetical protein
MRGNPEFIRNLWLEFTLHRVLVMPAIVGILFLLMYLVNGQKLDSATAVSAAILFCAIIFIWGTRVASESVIQEINASTWDTQRMSAMGPWSMAWGKLFGSTVFVWYGGFICMGLYWMSYIDILPEDRLAKLILVYILSGVIAHATGLLVSMQAVQKRRDFGRVQVAFYLLVGFAAALPGLYIGLSGWADDGVYRVMLFYDQVFPLIDCVLIALAVYSLWALIGIWRMMRGELQMVNGPWVWLAFVAFTVAAFAGIRLLHPDVGKAMPDISSKAYHGYAMLLILTYVIALAEPKGPVLFRRLRRYVQLHDWASFFNAMPRTILMLIFVLLASIVLLRLSESRITVLEQPINFHLATIATFLFVLRDVGFIYLLNISRYSPRNDMSAFLYLALSYTVIPVSLIFIGLDPLTAMFWPQWDSGAGLTLGPIVIQVLIVFALMARAWKTRVVRDGDVI